MEETANGYYHENDRITDGFDIFFWVFDDKSSYVAPHWHSAIEISYVIEGEMEVMLPNRTVTLLPGDLNLIDSGEIHATRSISGNRAVLIQLPYPMLSRYIEDFDSLTFTFDPHAQDEESRSRRSELVSTVRRMQYVFEERPKNGILRFNSLVFELIYQLCRYFSRPKSGSGRTPEGFKYDRIKAVMRYTEEHYAEPITLAQIAAVAAFQEEYFCHFFKKHMGVTYFQYLNELRMSHIHADLISTDLPLKAILDRHGFTNYKVFRRLFAQQYHTTPGQYRREKAGETGNAPEGPGTGKK